jgi:Fic family protein
VSPELPAIAVAVAPIGFSEHEWTVKNPEHRSKREVARQTGTYRSAITAPLRDLTLDIPGELAADADEATRALVGFDQHAGLALGISDPALGPMSAILLRTESASSSQIENLTTSAKQLALAELGEGDAANAVEVVGNVRAMEAALRLSDRISVDAILDMHRELTIGQWSMHDHAGRIRDQLVWIGGRDSAGPRGAAFIAPQHPLVRAALGDLVAFASRDDLPPLIQIAVAHAQFETIHPFVDGNGRTGRALVQSMLRHSGVLNSSTVPISAGLVTDTAGYIAALDAFRLGDAAPIIRRFSDAARYAAHTGIDLIDRLAARLESSRRALAGMRPQAAAWSLLPRLIGQPVVNTRYLTTHLGLSDMTALRALDALTDRGVLRERTGRARNRVWQHDGILQELDDYAARIRRSSAGGSP